ncbi:MAG: OmpA family protein, partial [Acidimicrobiales bacterium]
IGDDAERALGRLIEVFAPSERTLVVEVHTATESTAAANLELSGRQAEAIEDHLTAGGMPASRIKVFGGGDLRQFRGGDHDSLVVVTVVA